jgi:hypothetical protein
MNLSSESHFLQGEHGADNTNGSKSSELHAHATGAA